LFKLLLMNAPLPDCAAGRVDCTVADHFEHPAPAPVSVLRIIRTPDMTLFSLVILTAAAAALSAVALPKRAPVRVRSTFHSVRK
jgi:hypothetical protein